ncbi:MAG: aspartate/glutamate racemase family protein [Actinomycetota bacterium]
MPIYEAHRGQVAYGFSVGILCLEYHLPFIPGDVANASSYDFPVMFKEVPGASGDAVIVKQDAELTSNFIEAARWLVQQGCKAITSDCGYIGQYQDAVAEALEVPVFLSSLLQVPMVTRMLGPKRRLGIMVANGASVSDRFLDKVGITDRSRVYFQGLEQQPYFRKSILEESGSLDSDAVEAEVVETALDMQREKPETGAILMECSDLPPYSAAVQRATGLPVFDWIGFINYVHHAVVRTPYQGIF